MLIGSKSGFATPGSSLPNIDGIMMIGWFVDTGISGSNATSSFVVEADVMFPNMVLNSAENDFLGNYNGAPGSTVLFGVQSSKPYAFCFSENRAPSVTFSQWGTTVAYRVDVDYSGGVSVDVDGQTSSAAVTVSGFAASSEPFLIGNGGRAGGGYRPAPAIIKRAKFTLDGVIVADYMPMISGGKIGMKDVIRGTFESAPSGGVTLAYNSAWGGGINA